MSSRLATVQFICDQAGLGERLTWRKMFGEYALYVEGKIVALVCDDQLFLKPTPEGRTHVGSVPEASPYPGCKPFLLLSALLDEPERLSAALVITARALPAAKAKAKAKAKVVASRTPGPSTTVKVTLHRDGAMSVIPVPFDPKPLFGKVRAPVKVTLKGYTYRSTIFSMGRGTFVPLRTSHREAAGLEGTETLRVTFELDTDKRTVKLPPDLGKALRSGKGLPQKWEKLSYTHRREYAESVTGAKQPETRVRRIARVVAALKDKA